MDANHGIDRPRSREANRTPRDVQHVDFGCADARGRPVGAELMTWEMDLVPLSDGEMVCFWGLPAGHVYCWETHGTREGRRFGPLQSTHICRTAEERDAGLARYVETATRRARKAAGGAR